MLTLSVAYRFFRSSRVAFAKQKLLKVHPSTGVRLSAKFGQHLTVNPGIIDTMIEAADIRSTDTVLEIGCGTGNITMRLLEIAKKVVAVELESRFAEETLDRAKAAGFGEKFEVIIGDAIKCKIPKFDVCVANPPYNISAPLLFRLSSLNWRRTVLMLQKEFADRLTADPGDSEFSRLSMNAALYFRTERIQQVSGGSFYPQSAVKSMIVRLTPRYPKPSFDFREWDALMRLCFLERKRGLHAVLSKGRVLAMMEAHYKSRCSVNGLIPSLISFPDLFLSTLDEQGIARISTKKISADTMQKLLKAFHKKGIYFTNVAGGNTHIEEQPCRSFEIDESDWLQAAEASDDSSCEELPLNGS